MKNEILVLLGILVVSGCVSQSVPEPEVNRSDLNLSEYNETDSENLTMIYYTDAGFMPEEVSVSQGDTVVWVDESDRPMWVASDSHPRHTEYDGTSLNQHCSSGEEPFDQCREGGSFEFTFEKEGNWSYHNHRRSRHTGTVEVR
jgi:plastocyanin